MAEFTPFDIIAIEIKFKDKPKHALTIDLCQNRAVIEKNKKIQANDAGMLKWELSAWWAQLLIVQPTFWSLHTYSNINMDFDALAIDVKESLFLKKKDLVYYKVANEDVHALFKDHTKFPKGPSLAENMSC